MSVHYPHLLPLLPLPSHSLFPQRRHQVNRRKVIPLPMYKADPGTHPEALFKKDQVHTQSTTPTHVCVLELIVKGYVHTVQCSLPQWVVCGTSWPVVDRWLLVILSSLLLLSHCRGYPSQALQGSNAKGWGLVRKTTQVAALQRHSRLPVYSILSQVRLSLV